MEIFISQMFQQNPNSLSSLVNVLQPWFIVTTATISIRVNGVVQQLLDPQVSAITARQFEKVQIVAMHKPSRSMLKTNQLEPHCTIVEQRKASEPTIIWLEA